MTTTSQLDKLDLRILDLMQRNNRTTSDQIADKIGLSAAAVQRRLKRLREEKVIKADVSVIDKKAIGLAITLIVKVRLNNERIDLLDSFKKSMLEHPNVQQCFYVTGSEDFVLVVTTKSMEDYNSFTREAFFKNSNIQGFETNVVMDCIKEGMAVPL